MAPGRSCCTCLTYCCCCSLVAAAKASAPRLKACVLVGGRGAACLAGRAPAQRGCADAGSLPSVAGSMMGWPLHPAGCNFSWCSLGFIMGPHTNSRAGCCRADLQKTAGEEAHSDSWGDWRPPGQPIPTQTQQLLTSWRADQCARPARIAVHDHYLNAVSQSGTQHTADNTRNPDVQFRGPDNDESLGRWVGDSPTSFSFSSERQNKSFQRQKSEIVHQPPARHQHEQHFCTAQIIIEYFCSISQGLGTKGHAAAFTITVLAGSRQQAWMPQPLSRVWHRSAGPRRSGLGRPSMTSSR